MDRFLNLKIFVLTTMFGVGGGVYTSFLGALPLIFSLDWSKIGYYFSWFVSPGLMFLTVFMMWYVGRGVMLRKELVSTCVSLFLGAWLGKYLGSCFGRVVWWRSADLLFFAGNILFSAFSGLGLFFEGFTGMALSYLTRPLDESSSGEEF